MGYKILITAPELSAKAMQLLIERQATVETMSLTATADEVTHKVMEFQPDGIISRTAQLNRDAISAGKSLRAISKHGTGVDNIDLQAAGLRGIPVSRTLGANAQSVAEHTIAMMLALGRQLVPCDFATKQGEWPRSQFIGTEFCGRKLGLLGYGEIAKRTAAIARGLGMRILAYSPSLTPKKVEADIEVVCSIEELVSSSDVLSLHCALNDKTRGLVDLDLLSRLPRYALVLNTSRGAVIREKDLVEALDQGIIAGAGLDTFEGEPLSKDNPLCSKANVLLSPHVAGSTREAMERVAVEAVENLMAMLDGNVLAEAAYV